MASFKNFGISGIGPIVQIGKNGGVMMFSETVSDGTSSGTAPAFSFYDKNQTQLTRIQGGNPLQYNDLTTKLYVDNLVQGLNIKEAVRLASTTNVPLTGSSLNIDGVSVNNGDRVLLKNQTSATQNGIYDVSISGSTYSLTRSLDSSNTSESSGVNNNLSGGSFVFVTSGSSNADTGWVVSSPDGIVKIGTDSIVWTQFSSAGVTQPGPGLSKLGTVFSVNVDNNNLYVNPNTSKLTVQSSNYSGNVLLSNGQSNGNSTDASWGSLDLSNVNTVGSSILHENNGGTGKSSYTLGDILIGNSTSGLDKLPVGPANSFLYINSENTPSYEYVSSLRDSSGNIVASVSGSEKPINFLTIKNSDTGSNVIVGSNSSTDTDVGITLSPLGKGFVVAKDGYDADLQTSYGDVSDETFVTKGALNKRIGVVDTSMISNGTNNASGTNATSGNTYVATNSDGYENEVVVVSSDKLIAEFQSSTSNGVAVNGEHLKVTHVSGEVQILAVDTSGIDNVDMRLIPQSGGKVFLGNTGAGLIQAEKGFELDIKGGDSSDTNDSGSLVLSGGSASSNNLKGGNVVIRSGAGNGSGNNGSVYIQDFNKQNIVEYSSTTNASGASNWLQVINSPNSSDQLTSGLIIQPALNSGSANVSLILKGKGNGIVRVDNADTYNINLSKNTPEAFATVGYLNSVITAATITTGAGLIDDSNVFKLAIGANTVSVDTSGNAIVNSNGTKNNVMLSSGTLGNEAVWGSIPLSDDNSVSGILPVIHGGTGLQSISQGDILIGGLSNRLQSLSIDAANKILQSDGTSVKWNYLSNLYDGNGKVSVTTTGVNNPVNNLVVSNAAVAGAPTIGVDGQDTNISILLKPKGTGIISTPDTYNSGLLNGTISQDNSLTTKGYVDQAVLGHSDPMMRSGTVSSGWASTMNIDNVLPNIDGKNVVITDVMMTITTPVVGGGATNARIYAGTNTIMNIDENDISEIGSYVATLPRSFTSNNVQITIQFFKADGTSLAIPTSGNVSVVANYKLV